MARTRFWAVLVSCVLSSCSGRGGGGAGRDAGIDSGRAAASDASTSADTGASDTGALAIDSGNEPTELRILAEYTDAGHGIIYAGGFVYSVYTAMDQVVVFDVATRTEVTRLAVGSRPMKLKTDGTLVFAVNLLARDAGDAYVSVIDPRTNTVTHSLPVSERHEGTDPDNYPWTNFPYDATALAGVLYVVFPTNAVPDIGPVDIGTWHEHPLFAAGSGPGELAGIGDRLFVINGRAIANPDDDALVAYQTDGTMLMTYETGGRMHDVLAEGGKIFATHAPATAGAPGEVVVIDPVTLARRSIAVAEGPYGLASQNGLVYVMCQYAQHIAIIDPASESVVREIALSDFTPALTDPRTLAVAPSGDIYIESEGKIAVLIHP